MPLATFLVHSNKFFKFFIVFFVFEGCFLYVKFEEREKLEGWFGVWNIYWSNKTLFGLSKILAFSVGSINLRCSYGLKMQKFMDLGLCLKYGFTVMALALKNFYLVGSFHGLQTGCYRFPRFESQPCNSPTCGNCFREPEI